MKEEIWIDGVKVDAGQDSTILSDEIEEKYYHEFCAKLFCRGTIITNNMWNGKMV